MNTRDKIQFNIERILQDQYTDADLEKLYQLLREIDNDDWVLINDVVGKNIVGKIEGDNIHVGDRIYPQLDEEAIQALVKEIQKVSGIHQNTEGGDAAGRDLNKGNIYQNCTIIQLLSNRDELAHSDREVLNHFSFDEIPLEKIQQAYQDSLPPDAEIWNLEGNSLEQILKNLHKLRQFPQFFKCLSQDREISQKIRAQLQDFARKLAKENPSRKTQNTSSADIHHEAPSRCVDSYLLATLTHDDNPKYLLLNAWLITDDSVRNLSKYKSLLDPDEKQSGKLCKLTDVPKEFDKFLTKALQFLRGKKHELIIEFFLPSDLMCEEVDCWKIYDPITEEIFMGTKYQVRLRSLERLDINYLERYYSDWRMSWELVKQNLDNQQIQDIFETLEKIESFNRKSLKLKLRDKIGLKVTCAHPQSLRKDLFRAILSATTPIAVWTRTDLPNIDQLTAINQILTFKPLRHLCESVKHYREEADAHPEEHLGSHLALLWENPYRLTPDIMLQLNTPEQ